MAKFADKFFTILLLLAPFSTAWAAQDEPSDRDSLSLKNRHEVGTEFSIGHSHWNLGCIYGYARAQKNTSNSLLSLFLLEAGLKYGSRAEKYKYDSREPAYDPYSRILRHKESGSFTIREPSLYVPMSVGLLAIVPAWNSSLYRKVALGVGFEAVIALASRLLTEGKSPRDLLKTIPGLSRFSGSFFASLRSVFCWGVYFGVSGKLPINILAPRSLSTKYLYPKDYTLSKQDIDSFRVNTTSSFDLSLGLDIMQLLEDLGVYNPF